MNWIAKLAAIAVAVSFVCAAQTPAAKPAAKTVVWSPTNIGWPESITHATVPKPMITALKIGNLPITLEKTTLEFVQKRLGGTIGGHGDAGDSLAWLCFSGSDSTGEWIFWLDSGEMGGLSTIDGFLWRRLSVNEKPDRRCVKLPPGTLGVELPISLHLGSTEADARTALGKPSEVLGRKLFFYHEHSQLIRKEEFTVSNDIAVVIRNGSVWAIEGNQTTSN